MKPIKRNALLDRLKSDLLSRFAIRTSRHGSMPKCPGLMAVALFFAAMPISYADTKIGHTTDGKIKQPNIILILTDDQGWGDAGFIGHPYMKTPNIDRLAKEGTTFEQFYTSAPVCTPSRIGFMTGNYPARHLVNAAFRTTHKANYKDWHQVDFLDPNTTLVSKLLQDNGYATAHYGKWHMGGTRDAPKPAEYGFDDTLSTNSRGPGLYSSEYFDSVPEAGYKHAYSTHAIAHESIQFIEAHPDQPFYINFFTLLPHANLKPSPSQLAPYKRLKVDVNDFSPWMRPWLRTVNSSTRTAHMKAYCASMTALDEAIGMLLDKLDELGIADNTFIFFASDNGPDTLLDDNTAMAGAGSTGGLRSRKRSLWEGGIRTLAIARWPGHIPADRMDESSVITGVDWLPTVLSLASIPMPSMSISADGEDRSPAFMKPTARTRPIFWERRRDINTIATSAAKIYDHSRPLVMREGDWKLMMNYNGSSPHLYNIPNDPEERVNLQAKEKAIRDSMKADLKAWKASLPVLPRD